MPADQKQQLGPIETDVAYPLAVFGRRAGLGPAALRTARRQGLRVCSGGGRKWVIGADWLDYLDRQNPRTKGGAE